MKIRKLYMAVFSIFISAQITSAQQNMFVLTNDGNAYAISASSVSYATFNVNNKWFTITNDGIEATTTTSFSASCTVGLAADSDVKELTITPIVGVCYSKDNTTPTIDDDCEPLGSQLESYTFSLSPLLSGTTYYYRIYVELADGVLYGDVAKAKTLGTKPIDQTINGHKFINLDLPSGLLWAETNIGAETAADDGNYYAWGETEPQSSNQYSWSSYKYGTSSSNLTKYNDTDNKTTLDNEDDAAYVNWGSPCRMPTNDEFSELLNSSNCIWTLTSKTNSDGSSVYGYKITSIKNGNSIFLTASGSRSNENFDGRGWFGYYWSSTLGSSSSSAFFLYFSYLDGDRPGRSAYNRCYGYTIRPVAEP